MNGEWGRGGGVEIGCIQWDVDRVVSGENGDEMNGDVQWFVCLDRDGESDWDWELWKRLKVKFELGLSDASSVHVLL